MHAGSSFCTEVQETVHARRRCGCKAPALLLCLLSVAAARPTVASVELYAARSSTIGEVRVWADVPGECAQCNHSP